MAKSIQQVEQVTIRFAGDSGDGMQLTGTRFTSETAAFGNDLSTLPDFPAEIRAPAGSLPGVSGFQIHFADHDILTPGDQPDVLVAMNPAALKTNLKDLRSGGTLILNRDSFNDKNLQKAAYGSNPLEDGSLDDYNVHALPLTSMTVEALKGIEGVTSREAERSKNFFALGLMSWLYGRPIDSTLAYIGDKFGSRPELAEANTRAFKAGFNYGETRPAGKAGWLSTSARTRSRRRRRSSRSSRATSSSESGRSRPRTRSQPWAPPSARRSAAHSESARRPGRASS